MASAWSLRPMTDPGARPVPSTEPCCRHPPLAARRTVPDQSAAWASVRRNERPGRRPTRYAPADVRTSKDEKPQRACCLPLRPDPLRKQPIRSPFSARPARGATSLSGTPRPAQRAVPSLQAGPSGEHVPGHRIGRAALEFAPRGLIQEPQTQVTGTQGGQDIRRVDDDPVLDPPQ